MNPCTDNTERFRGAGGKCIKVSKYVPPAIPWLRTIRKVRDSYNKNLSLQIAATRVAVEESLIDCADVPICVTCRHWEIKEDEPSKQYGYCRADSHHELMEYDETCKVWEPFTTPY